jgi:hypothetical protein
MSPTRKKYVCWDLDETLGYFRPGKKSEFVRGMPALLEELQKRGIGNVITTASHPLHAALALDRTKTSHLFDAVFGSDVMCDNGYKRYGHVADRLGISMDDAVDRMIIVGNLDNDSSTDLNLVTVIYPDAIKYDASVIGDLLGRMMQHQSWWCGYEMLLNAALPHFKSGFFEGGTMHMEDIALAIGRIGKNEQLHTNEMLVWVHGAGPQRRAEIATIDEPEDARARETEVFLAESEYDYAV